MILPTWAIVKALLAPAFFVFVDPPWYYSNRWITRKTGDGRNTFGPGAAGRYPVMKVDELAALPIGELGAADSYCLLWVTGPYLVTGEAADVMRAWGWEPITVLSCYDTIVPYDMSLTVMTAEERRAWGNRVTVQLVSRLRKSWNAGPAEFRWVCLAGNLYRRPLILSFFDRHGITPETPLRGLGIGKQQAALRDAIDNGLEITPAP